MTAGNSVLKNPLIPNKGRTAHETTVPVLSLTLMIRFGYRVRVDLSGYVRQGCLSYGSVTHPNSRIASPSVCKEQLLRAASRVAPRIRRNF